MDSLLATVQMPGDVPVATVGVGMGGPRNAGLLAVQILGVADEKIQKALADFKVQLVEKIEKKNRAFQETLSE